MFIAGMLLLAGGCALWLDTFLAAHGVLQDSPRPGTPGARQLRLTRMVAVGLAVLLVTSGLALLFLAPPP